MTEHRQGHRRRMWQHCLFAIESVALILAPARAHAELRDKLSPPHEYTVTISAFLAAHLLINYIIIGKNMSVYRKIIIIFVNILFLIFDLVILDELASLNVPPPWRMEDDREGYSLVYIFPIVGLLVPVGTLLMLGKAKNG